MKRDKNGTKCNLGVHFYAYPTKKMSKNQNLPRINNAMLRSYTLPVYRCTKDCDYVEYYAYNPATEKLQRKRIKVNTVKGAKARKHYAYDLIARLTEKLSTGWNPFIEQMNTAEMRLITYCLDEFEKYNERMFEDGTFRQQTHGAYKYKLAKIKEYVQTQKKITYLYQFDTAYCSSFLDYLYLDLKYSGTTRNNYLTFIKVLFTYFMERGFTKECPTTSIKKIPSRMLKKEREILPTDAVGKISEYLLEKDKFFLLACYLLYYCFIRPQELCRLKIHNLQLGNHVIYIKGDQAKNRKDEYVTIPSVLEDFIRSFRFERYPSDFFIFSKRMKPGDFEISPCRFDERWIKLRKALGFPASYKFYSLKDTGITELSDNHVTNLTIRDQARHSSLAITDVYTRHASARANEELLEYEGSL